ncbi:hypothetical protein [Acetobacter sicerae]|uniref:hypothetical protein n=1 Tax=Acetobacter sicerae TaxID=85325 RepID=UPI00156A8758|nr:hypothetical protein [Acetobacter sicerae]NHN93614.1 hypothetical protein [Acetobacter sicerae]
MTSGDLPWDHLPPRQDRAPRQSTPRHGKRGRPPKDHGAAEALASDPDGWVGHHLTVYGPVDVLSAFRTAARGPGVIPWILDPARQEEDLFLLLGRRPTLQRGLSVQGCHLLARQLADSVVRARAADLARAAEAWACPLDLHRLLPVPPDLLESGEGTPDAVAWLKAHWGTVAALRRVVERRRPNAGRQLQADHAVAGWSFFSLGGSPHQAVGALRDRWFPLVFRLDVAPSF